MRSIALWAILALHLETEIEFGGLCKIFEDSGVRAAVPSAHNSWHVFQTHGRG